MNEVKVWEEKVLIPTYGVGEAEKNPVFLENRVYQGSSGKVQRAYDKTNQYDFVY